MITIISIIYYLYKYNYSEDNYSDNKIYRLGDMIKNFERNKKYYLKNFPNSIATEYMLLTEDDNNLNILNNIIDRRITYKHTKFKDYIIVHLRTRDIFELPRLENRYTKQMSYYKKRYQYKKNINNNRIL